MIIGLNIIGGGNAPYLGKGGGGDGFVIKAEKNPALVAALYEANACASPQGVTKAEALALVAIPSTIVGNKEITSFDEIRKFKNLEAIDLSGTGIEGVLDLTSNTLATEIDLSGTPISPKVKGESLVTLNVGSPESVSIDGCVNLENFDIYSSENTSELDIKNMNA